MKKISTHFGIIPANETSSGKAFLLLRTKKGKRQQDDRFVQFEFPNDELAHRAAELMFANAALLFQGLADAISADGFLTEREKTIVESLREIARIEISGWRNYTRCALSDNEVGKTASFA